jgi:hypothetical protein
MTPPFVISPVPEFGVPRITPPAPFVATPVRGNGFGLFGDVRFGLAPGVKLGFPGGVRFGFPGGVKFGLPGGVRLGLPGGVKFGFAGGTIFGLVGVPGGNTRTLFDIPTFGFAG